MLYKTAFTVGDIPPLFVQLDKLEKIEDAEPNENGLEAHWKEKSR